CAARRHVNGGSAPAVAAIWGSLYARAGAAPRGAPENHGAGPGEWRNTLTWDQKFALDVWYVDHRSIGLDVRILLRTIGVVGRRGGVGGGGAAGRDEGDGPARPGCGVREV